MGLKGQDYLYLGLGAGALYLILRNTKPLSQIVSGASGVVSPLLSAAGKGAAIVTNPKTWDFEDNNYTYALLKSPMSPIQTYRVWKNAGGFMGTSLFSPESINMIATYLGIMR